MEDFLAALDQWLTADRVFFLTYIYNSAVQAMPEPNGSKFYRWLYRFSHLLAANIRVTAKKFDTGEKKETETEAVNALLVAKLKELDQQQWLDATFKEEVQ